jgi:hypothetical protein
VQAEIEQTIRDVSKPKTEGGEIRKNVFLIFARPSPPRTHEPG